MATWLKAFATKSLCAGMSFILAVQPALAQVVPDAQAPANKASMGAAANGVPVVNIVAPNAAGISHNKFTDFNVARDGLILNNSRTVGQSQLGGVLAGNPNFASSSEARLILNEVTSTNRSQLLGFQEIFGRSADYILANPNGITCNGCGFINTPRATLTTGLPQFDALGNLSALDVNSGDVAFEGAGYNSTGISYFDIISRTASINADIHAGNLSIITGRNTVDYATRVASAKADDGQPKPTVAIDSSVLGGMYAGRISLVGTEQGVGVNLAGDMATSSSDLVISADGQITMRNAAATRDVIVTASGSTITSQGTVQSGRNVRYAAANIVNDATISSGADTVLEATTEVDNRGTVHSDGNLSAVGGTVRNRTGAKLESAGNTEVDGSLVNAGEVLAAGDIDARVASLDNSGSLKAGGRLNVTGTSNLTVGGLLVGSGGMGLAANGTLTSAAGSQLFSIGLLSLAISGDFTNSGALSITGDLTGTVNRFTNSGNLQVSNDIDVVVNDRLDNTDLLLALGNMSFQVGNTLRNDGGSLVAGGNISLTGIGGGRMGLLENVSGTIESFDGDILIGANVLDNRKSVFAMSSQVTFSQYYAANQEWHPGCNTVPGATISGAGCSYFGNTIAHVPHPWKPNYTSYYASYSGDGGITVTVYEDVVSQDSAASLISAGRHLTVDGGTINNNMSDMKAVGNIALTGSVLNNTGAAVRRQLYHSASVSDPITRCYGGPCRWFEFNNSAQLLENEIVGSHDGRIVAGGSFTGNFTGQVNNTTIVEQSTSLPPGGIPYVNQITTATPSQLDIPVVTAPPPPSLFQRAAPSEDYVFETRFAYTDFGTFYGSDYFLSQIGLTLAQTEELPKRLGDAYYDTRLVSEQVTRLTGQRLMDGAASDATQMQAMIQAAAAQQAGLNLTVGIALTASQVAALTDSIVWYVEEQFEGQTVLVPKLYLAATDQGNLTPQGAFIAANDISIQADRIENSGRLAAANDLTLEAQDSIVNSSGQIAADRNIRLVAVNGDVINTTATQTVASDIASQTVEVGRGGIYAGGSLEVTAGRDIRVQGAEMSAGGDATLDAGRDVTFTTNELNRQVAYSSNGFSLEQRSTTNAGSGLIAGGDATITAGRDINVKGSDIAAVQDLSLQATDNVTIEAAQDYNYSHSERSKSSSFNSGTSESTTASASTLQGGRNVSVTAGADLTLAGSAIGAGQDVTLTGTNVNIESIAEYFRESRIERRSGWKGGFRGGMVTVGKYKTNQTLDIAGTSQAGSTVMAGRDLTIQSTQDATVTASGLGAGRDLTVEAGRDLTFEAAVEQYRRHEVFEQSFTGFTFGVKENVSAVADAASTINDGQGGASYEAISAASGALRTVAATMQAVQQTVAVEIGFGTNKSRTETTETAETAAVSTLTAGRDTTLTAGRDLTMQGTQLQSGSDVTLIAGRDANLASAQNSFSSSYDHESSSSGVTASVGYGAFGPSGSVTAYGNTSSANQNYSGTSQTHTNVSAGGDVLLLTGNDATLKGATVRGDNVTVDVGGDLNVQSVADTGTGSGNSSSAGVSIGYGLLGQGAGNTSLGASGSVGDSSAEKSWISQQSGLVGSGDVDVTVQGHTQLDAGIIASSGGNVSLDTGSFGWSNAQGYDRSESTTIGGSASVPVGGGQGGDNNDSGSNLPLPGMPFNTASLDYNKTDREQVTRATIGAPNGSTTITVRDNPAQNLSELNSDLAKAQEITKDTKASVRVYIDVNAITEIANGLPTIGAGLEQLGEGLQQIVREIRAITYALPDDMKHIGQSGEKVVTTMLRAGVDGDTAEALMRNPQVASELTQLSSVLDQIQSLGFDATGATTGGVSLSDGSTTLPTLEVSAAAGSLGAEALATLSDLSRTLASLPLEQAQMALLAAQALIAPGQTALMLALNAVVGEPIQQIKDFYSEKITTSVTGCGAATDCYAEMKPGTDLLINVLTGVSGAVIVGGIKSNNPGVELPGNSAQLKHIFRDAPGHLPDTPANRQLLVSVVTPANKLGTDARGIDWFGQLQPDGKQVWVSVRGGVIQNGGLNETPRTFNPMGGLSGGN